MNRLRGTAGAVAATAAAALLVGCGTVDAGGQKRQSSTFTVPGVESGLNVRAEGDVTLVATDGDQVTVHRTERWTNRGNKPDATHTIDNGTLRLASHCDAPTIGASGCGASYRIQVPRAHSVTVHTDHGKLSVRSLAGPVTLSTDSGSVRAEDMRSPSLKIRTDHGSITARGPARDVDLRTDSGSIDAHGLDARTLSATTGHGSITVSGTARTARLRTDSGRVRAQGLTADSMDARTEHGSVRLQYVKPPRRVIAVTDSGSVEVRLPIEEPYRFRLRTDSGSRTVDGSLRDDPDSDRTVELTTQHGGIHVRPA